MATKFEAREITPDEFEIWDKLVSNYGTIFQSIRWTKIFEPNIKRIGIYDKGGNLRGGFCYFEEHKFGLKIFRNPPFTPNIGPFYEKLAKNPAAKNNEQREVVKAMVEYIEKQKPALVSLSLVPEVVDGMPFYWRDYKVMMFYTYRIYLQDIDFDVKKIISSKLRHHIRKALKDGLEVREEFDINILKSHVLATFVRQNKRFPKSTMEKILSAFLPGTNSFLLITRRNDNPIASVYCVYDNQIAYRLLSGYDQKRAHHGAVAIAGYQAILKAKEINLKIFDFEGSMIRAIEEQRREFGAKLTPYIRVNKAFLPLEILLKFYKRQLF